MLVPVRGDAKPYLPDLPARPMKLHRAVRHARYAAAHRHPIVHERHVRKVRVAVKHRWRKPTRLVRREAPHRVKVILKKRVRVVHRGKVALRSKHKPGAPSRDFVVADKAR